jgi:hypothetical protein
MSTRNKATRITRRPKANNRLASEILDPRFYQDLFRFCDNIAVLIAKHYRIQCSPDHVECAARYWADSMNLGPDGKLETLVYEALDAFSKEFKGWTPSRVLEDSSDLPDDSQFEDQLSL